MARPSVLGELWRKQVGIMYEAAQKGLVSLPPLEAEGLGACLLDQVLNGFGKETLYDENPDCIGVPCRRELARRLHTLPYLRIPRHLHRKTCLILNSIILTVRLLIELWARHQ